MSVNTLLSMKNDLIFSLFPSKHLLEKFSGWYDTTRRGGKLEASQSSNWRKKSNFGNSLIPRGTPSRVCVCVCLRAHATTKCSGYSGLSQDDRIKQRRAWLLLGWVTAERLCPCKQSTCPTIGGGSEVTFKPLVPCFKCKRGLLSPNFA
ncbi:hypothetical protein J6590_017351 [Homalodisca vitripennis]|nr:hypothetical protein J6590_017351 [Homalodisca vitripennis]